MYNYYMHTLTQWTAASELTSEHVPYRRNTRFFCTVTRTTARFTRYTESTRFTRENEAIVLAFEISINHSAFARTQRTRKGVINPDILVRKGTGTGDQKSESVEWMFSCNLRCDDGQNRLSSMTLEKIVTMHFMNDFFKNLIFYNRYTVPYT